MKTPASASTDPGRGPTGLESNVTDRICSVDGCGRKYRAGGLCEPHYNRQYKLTHPLQAKKPGPPCIIDGCETLSHAAKMCAKHYYRKLRNGAPDIVKGGKEGRHDLHHHWSGDRPTYRAAHKRLTRDRGSAADTTCVDCGQPAKHWSYDHADPNELRDPAHGAPYSVDPARYSPRCPSCHKLFDDRHVVHSGRWWYTTPGGDPYTETQETA